MKTLFAFLTTLLFCYQAELSAQTLLDSTLTSTIAQKKLIEGYKKKYERKIILLAKVPGKKSLVKVVNQKWPDETEVSYNILKDTAGRIRYITQSPVSESGDWDIAYDHYFDENGNTIAFYAIESIFDDNVKGGIVRKSLLKYYDADFKPLKQINSLSDVKFRPIKKSKQEFNFKDDKYVIYKDVTACLKGYNVILK
ncbi:hypothetical protein [Mucilaginibacter myungsuensis]|uniref:Uncharacterized protein n=1 Tax=Mucilaginibacter myungsuensis TaxID=649104 RepID=A0A929KV03_9SPHI|nr:hypothetical protein [Mucilaginibacter myungsuensis]MBE9662079.1 hypothetical protein [Mucilaginibacter myungsuensis]MDN3599487.1 hypothetical protein [Mucilaginibacter myungsuensis]